MSKDQEKEKNTKAHKLKIVTWRTLLMVIAAVIFGAGIYSWNAQSLTGDKMPMPLGYGASIVLSGSMEPELSVDDMIVVKATDEVAVGDVVVFQDGNSLVVHKIIKIDGELITTQGDANNTADDPITKDKIKGKLLFAVPKVGVVVEFIRQPVVMIAMSCMILVLSELAYKKEKKSDTDELSALEREIAELRELKEKQEADISAQQATDTKQEDDL